MAATSPYPDNDRAEWVVVPLDTPYRDAAGLLCWSYAVYASLASQQGGDLPFLLNSHKSMIREHHQRQAESPDGRLRHISGELVATEDTGDFLANEPAAYRWVDGWTDDRGRSLTPFSFPTYQGATEELDPQWERDRYAISEDSQRIATQDNYLAGVQARRTAGDRRGTTLDLQVSASADDGRFYLSFADITTVETPSWIQGTIDIGWAARFLAVTIPNAATIDVAYLTHKPRNNQSGATSRTTLIYCEDADDPATYSAVWSDFNGRVLTTAYISFGLPDQTAETDINTPSLVAPVQEVVNRGGFVSGNAMSFQMPEAAPISGKGHAAHSYDSDTAKALKFHCEYTAAPPPTVTGDMFLVF